MDSDLTANKLFTEISQLIDTTKNRVAQKVNASLVLLYWQIGIRINTGLFHKLRNLTKFRASDYLQSRNKQYNFFLPCY